MDVNTKRTYITMVTLLVCVLVSTIGLFFSLRVFMSTANLHSGSFWCHVLILLGALVSIVGVTLNFAGSMVLYVGFAMLGMADVFCLVGVIVDFLTGSHIHSINFSNCRFKPNNGTVMCKPVETLSDFGRSCVVLHGDNVCICCKLFIEQDCLEQRSIETLQRKPYLFQGVPSCQYVGETLPSLHWISGCICSLAFVCGVAALISLYLYRTIMNRVSGWSHIANMNSDAQDDRDYDLIQAPRRIRASSARVNHINVHGPVVIYATNQPSSLYSRGPMNGPPVAVPRSAPPYGRSLF